MVSIRYIAHLEAENIELRAENARLKEFLLGRADTITENEVTAPTGGIKTRAEVARDIRIRVEQREKAKKAANG